ncbi:MAG: DsbA family protein [Sporichthyaceae bacterium]
MDLIEAVEYTDPFCSWAWGTEPKYRRLRWQYGERLAWRRVVCAIWSPGWHRMWSEEADTSPLCPKLSGFFGQVSQVTGMPYPDPVEYLHGSSEDPCRLVKAAEHQGPEIADAVVRRLRESLLVWGRPADTLERGLAAVAGVCDVDRLAADVAEPSTEKAYLADWEEARTPNSYVLELEDKRPGRGAAQPHGDRMRYGLPALTLTGPAGTATVAGWREWAEWESALEAVAPGIVARARPLPTPAEAFATWPLLARAELDELCGTAATVPDGVESHEWPGGRIWLAGARPTG